MTGKDQTAQNHCWSSQVTCVGDPLVGDQHLQASAAHFCIDQRSFYRAEGVSLNVRNMQPEESFTNKSKVFDHWLTFHLCCVTVGQQLCYRNDQQALLQAKSLLLLMVNLQQL